MRVSINHTSVSRGFLFKKTYHEVTLSVLFSHEQKQIIRQRRLGDTALLERRPATAKVDDRDEKFALYLSALINGQSDRFLCANPAAAKRYEESLLEALAHLHGWIHDNADEAPGLVVEF